MYEDRASGNCRARYFTDNQVEKSSLVNTEAQIRSTSNQDEHMAGPFRRLRQETPGRTEGTQSPVFSPCFRVNWKNSVLHLNYGKREHRVGSD